LLKRDRGKYEKTACFAFLPREAEKGDAPPVQEPRRSQAIEREDDQGLFRALPVLLCGKKVGVSCQILGFSLRPKAKGQNLKAEFLGGESDG
jgi:hypothetical protein